MDRGEIERDREAGRIVTVCDVLVSAVTHCNGVGLYFTGSILHGTNIRLSARHFCNTHTHSHTSMGLPCMCDQHSDTLIHSYTPLQMAILCSRIIVAAIPVMA